MRSQEGSQARHSPQEYTTHLSCAPSSSRAAAGDRQPPVAPPSTPVPSGYAGLQGRICIHQRPPAPNKGLQSLHRGVPSLSPLLSLLSPTVAVNTHTYAGDRPRAQPQCCSMGATAGGGHRDMSDTAQSLPTALWLLTLTCWHCPPATSCCRFCSSSPGCPAACNNTAGQRAVPPLLGTGVPVPPVPLLPGHGGLFLFTVLVKLARGVQAPLSTAHSEPFPPCSSSRRSSGWPGSAPGNVPGGWVGGEGKPRRAPLQLDPQAAPTLPPKQYSRSRRHWVSRTCPLLHTCPREWINIAWG